MEPGDQLAVRIDEVAYPGRGVARVDGKVVFVDGVLPGEEVQIRVKRVRPRFAEADPVSIDLPSPDRLPAARDPATFRHAPGCVYDHSSHDAELRIKQSQLESLLSRLPCAAAQKNGAPLFAPPFASPLAEHYRNKIVLHAAWGEKGDDVPEGLVRGNRPLRLGYVRDDGIDGVIDVPQCLLARDPINERLAALRSKPATLARLRAGQTVTLRWTETDGVLWWIDTPSDPPTVTEISEAGPFEVPADGFFQMNPEVARGLVGHVRDWVVREGCAGKPIVDLYCGVGVFGITCAKGNGAPLTGVESAVGSARAARRNASAHGVKARIETMDVAKWLKSKGADAVPWSEATVIVDPPRAGLAKDVVESIAARRPSRIAYVSCEPSTLARDLAGLAAAGYGMVSARLFDMFPRTSHFETAVFLVRNG